jgi:hypothetical protein
MSNLLVERREEISKLLAIAEQRFEKLKQTFAQANDNEGADLDMRFAIGDVQVCMNLAYEALTEKGE